MGLSHLLLRTALARLTGVRDDALADENRLVAAEMEEALAATGAPEHIDNLKALYEALRLPAPL
jgi:hypothetical protein